ncbi:Hypothetical predicted protein [Octopus vulgaris]|uniref:Uncharacterized protein n=1 Tax=Octopus vulgaris TaxID=6645 RepID=A0AA36BWN3_OCTVU|nr:Hypothetical predicted protein [Octopus vulgaris]
MTVRATLAISGYDCKSHLCDVRILLVVMKPVTGSQTRLESVCSSVQNICLKDHVLLWGFSRVENRTKSFKYFVVRSNYSAKFTAFQ